MEDLLKQMGMVLQRAIQDAAINDAAVTNVIRYTSPDGSHRGEALIVTIVNPAIKRTVQAVLDSMATNVGNPGADPMALPPEGKIPS